MSATETTEAHHCFYHPNTPTELRCNRCGKYICVRDAVLTPVGYRCRDCVHAQQGVFFNAVSTDYLIAALVAFPIAYIGALIATRVSWFSIFLGPGVGIVISEAIRVATKKRRGRYTWAVALGGVIIATLIIVMPTFNFILDGRFAGNGATGVALNVVFMGVYLVLCGGTIINRLKLGEKI